MAGPYYKWSDDYSQGNEELTPDDEIKDIFNEMQGYLLESAILSGYKNLEQISTQLGDFINNEIAGIFTEMISMGAIAGNDAPKFVTDYSYHWPDLSTKYKKLKNRRGLSGRNFFFLSGDLLQELSTENPLYTLGGSLVNLYVLTPGFRLNSRGQLINSSTGRYVKYEEIEYSIGYSFLGRAFQYIKDGMPPELLLPRSISKKLLGNRRAGKTKTRKEVNEKTLKWETKTQVIDAPTELQTGAVRPMLIPMLYWFESYLEDRVKDKLSEM